jgi:sulfatase maturation enzyme AslB (radical SAM superfamily)|tara:strand:- start:752 stop:1888 length:1137 start_codon:yes stop_codon:yes gene_type:complete
MSSDKKKLLKDKYEFKTNYIKNFDIFKKDILEKKIVPHQVEFQAPPRGKKICWLECPYCYGLSAEDTKERLDKNRGIQVLEQILNGGVKKIIFAGYATDPLNCSYIEDLLDLTISKKAIFGFNTKALRVSEKFLSILDEKKIIDGSYVSLSIDAGSNETYNKIHNVKGSSNLYDKVLENVQNLGKIRNKNRFDLSAAYLVNIHSANSHDYEKFINDFTKAGCNLLRFTFPQQPKDIKTEKGVVPSKEEVSFYKKELHNLKNKYETDQCSILVIDADNENNIYNKPRTVPCYARYVYPTVGFDGWLYNCSQSSAPNFRSTALGDLNKSDFWDLFYGYETKNFEDFSFKCNAEISRSGCRCDRKEHIVNNSVIESKIFKV